MARIYREYFEHYAKELKIGDSGYYPHEGCTTSTKMWVYNSATGYGAYCNKCGDKGSIRKGIRHISELNISNKQDTQQIVKKVTLPKDITTDMDKWHKDAKLWLYSSDVRNVQIEKYGITYSKGLHRAIIPVYNEDMKLVMWQGRGLDSSQTKYYNTFGINKNEVLFKSWVMPNKVHEHSFDRVVLCEDALSVIKVGKVCNAVASLGTSLSNAQVNYLAKFKEVIIWYDEDTGGLLGGNKVYRKLSLFTKVIRIRTKEDPKKLSYQEIKEILT